MILVIEDELQVVEYLKQYLTLTGADTTKVMFIQNNDELDSVLSSGKVPEVTAVFADYHLSRFQEDTTGGVILEQLRDAGFNGTVYSISAETNPENLETMFGEKVVPLPKISDKPARLIGGKIVEEIKLTEESKFR
ncbi:MAG: hypothetical protein ABI721_05015 [Candidatus Dojkabacteria bacterium]